MQVCTIHLYHILNHIWRPRWIVPTGLSSFHRHMLLFVMSMYMLPLILVFCSSFFIMCLFVFLSGRESVQLFYCLFIHALSFEIQLSG